MADTPLAGGDDIIDLGDGSLSNYGFGGSGNDKIIGGSYMTNQKLYGGHGDDKIWVINPEQRETFSGG